MTPIELIPLLDKGMVEELRMYYNGRHSVVDIRNIPCSMPDYQIVKMWNSENGKGISVLLADNMAEDKKDSRDNAYGEFIKSLHVTDREFVYNLLREFEKEDPDGKVD